MDVPLVSSLVPSWTVLCTGSPPIPSLNPPSPGTARVHGSLASLRCAVALSLTLLLLGSNTRSFFACCRRQRQGTTRTFCTRYRSRFARSLLKSRHPVYPSGQCQPASFWSTCRDSYYSCDRIEPQKEQGFGSLTWRTVNPGSKHISLSTSIWCFQLPVVQSNRYQFRE